MSFTKIIHPITNQQLSIFSESGKKILKYYIKYYNKYNNKIQTGGVKFDLPPVDKNGKKKPISFKTNYQQRKWLWRTIWKSYKDIGFINTWNAMFGVTKEEVDKYLKTILEKSTTLLTDGTIKLDIFFNDKLLELFKELIKHYYEGNENKCVFPFVIDNKTLQNKSIEKSCNQWLTFIKKNRKNPSKLKKQIKHIEDNIPGLVKGILEAYFRSQKNSRKNLKTDIEKKFNDYDSEPGDIPVDFDDNFTNNSNYNTIGGTEPDKQDEIYSPGNENCTETTVIEDSSKCCNNKNLIIEGEKIGDGSNQCAVVDGAAVNNNKVAADDANNDDANGADGAAVNNNGDDEGAAANGDANGAAVNNNNVAAVNNNGDDEGAAANGDAADKKPVGDIVEEDKEEFPEIQDDYNGVNDDNKENFSEISDDNNTNTTEEGNNEKDNDDDDNNNYIETLQTEVISPQPEPEVISPPPAQLVLPPIPPNQETSELPPTLPITEPTN